MRILAFCYEYPPIGGGAGNALSFLAREWARCGHEITVVTSLFGGLPEEEMIDGIQLIRLRAGRQQVHRSRLLEMVRYMAQSTHRADLLFRRFRPEVCTAFFAIPCGPAAYRIRKKFGVPFVTQLRGGDVPGFDPETLRWHHLLMRPWIRRIWRGSAELVANSRGLASLAPRTLPGISPVVIPNGVDAECYSPPQAREHHNRFRLLYVGRFAETQKNIMTLLGALHRTCDVEATLVGDGPDAGRLKREVRRLGLGDRVVFAGWLREEALVEAFRGADVYVSASLYEGMPNAALEAMACGLPLVLSKTAGHDELVRHGENGFLFSPRDEAELARLIERLAQDSEAARGMGQAGRRRALQDYSWTQIAERQLEVMRRAAEGCTVVVK